MTINTSVIGYPRIGAHRELKQATEAYFNHKIDKSQLLAVGSALRRRHWAQQKEAGIDYISSNDFSFYDSMLDMMVLLNAIPPQYHGLGLDDLDTYFAMAKGYQSANLDIKALPMKKWFNTNYHYLVPQLDENSEIKLVGDKPFTEYLEAKEFGLETKPVIIGPFTFLKLSQINAEDRRPADFAGMLIKAYQEILTRFNTLNTQWLQIDEPALVMDLSPEELTLFRALYHEILTARQDTRILIQTYFSDVDQAVYQTLIEFDFDAIGLDFIEGQSNLDRIRSLGFPSDKILFAGVINGKNIWVNDYRRTLDLLKYLGTKIDCEQIVINTSCSLLHVPYSLKFEVHLPASKRQYFAFAEEKLAELGEIKSLWNAKNYQQNPLFLENARKLSERSNDAAIHQSAIREKTARLTDFDFKRQAAPDKREDVQRKKLNLPLLPTTTIGSFPQTAEIRKLRFSLRKGLISAEQYEAEIKSHIADVIRLQEEIGLDVLVHGEYERNDMVEYFAEHLNGFLLTENGWVQSYGTRCVKPPIIFGDVSRPQPITVKYISYAQSLTEKPVKGMLTGPITILNWSFPREDISHREIAYQIGLAIRQEVLDLEAAGIRIIQIDEAAFREKLPLHQKDWAEYFDWTTKAFHLAHAAVRLDTQIHTHMCYSELGSIIDNIAALDADVFTFEAARSDFNILEVMKNHKFPMQAGPGVYDNHSPRIPSKDEIRKALQTIVEKIDPQKAWCNPDCGLKTRNMKETIASLRNMVSAAAELRKEL